jgi:hypothetical protein
MESVNVFCKEAVPAVFCKFFKRLMWFFEFPHSSDNDSANPFLVTIKPKLEMGF